MKKKKFYKNLWIWLLITSILFFFTNIVFSIIFRGSDGSNIFTAVSGWVSGIATIALGFIAVVQNRKYKEENDRFLSAQQKINSQLMQEQNDLSWRKIHYDFYNSYRREFLEYEKEFSKYSISEISAKTLANHDTIRAIGELSIFDNPPQKIITICDPCCGGGGMAIAALDVLKNDYNINYAMDCFIECADIDIRCVHMTYLQLALAGVPAIIKHQNTLTQEFWSVWKTPAYIFQYHRFYKYQ